MVVKEKGHSMFVNLLKFYLFLAPLDFLPIIPNFSLSKLLIFLPLFGFLVELRHRERLILKRESLWLLLYIVAASISLIASINVDAGISRIITLILNIGVVILFASKNYTQGEAESLMKAMALSGWLLVVLSLVYSDFEVMSGRMTVVVNGSKQDPNELCGFFVFPMCYYLHRFVNNRKSVFSLVSVLAFLVIVLLTGSRGGLIAMAISIVVLLLKNATKSKRAFLKTFIVILVVLIAIYFLWGLLPEDITKRFTKDFNEEDAGANRFLIWESIIYKFENSDFARQMFGYGVATVTMYTTTRQVAHNVWLEAIIEMGIVGFAMLFLMYVRYGIRAFKLKKYNLVFATFCGYMTMCFSLSLFSYKPIWNILLLIVIMCSLSKNEEIS